MEHWKQRTEMMLGAGAVEKLSRSSVLVVGLGGVGAMAAEMMCRAGVGHMTIIDRDVVNSTNINRQIIALHSTIGRKKAEVLSERLKDINPDVQLTVINDWLDSENTEKILMENHFDFLVDAIDTLTPKVLLIQTAVQKDIRIVSSMGSGGKSDPSKIKLADISETEYCALAKNVRKRLSKAGIKKGVPVVYSTELVDKKNVILIEDELYKRSTTGTVSYMPAMFGCYLASYVIRELIKDYKD